MPYSTCCGAYTDFTDIDICPDCLEHCDFEDYDEDDIEADIEADNQIEQNQINKHEN